MSQLTVTIGDPVVAGHVADVVDRGDYASPSEYVLALIDEDRKRRAKQKLQALLLEGLEGEASELTDADWDEMRRRFDERHPETAKP